MCKMTNNILNGGLFFIIIILMVGCLDTVDGTKRPTKTPSSKKDFENEKLGPLESGNDTGACNQHYWSYVYNPARLEIVDKCKTVTGIIEESSPNEDGDQHMLLRLDKGQEHLVNEKNLNKKQGDLVIEAVCANKVLRRKVGNTCEGYINKILIPQVGQHVSVTGSYVIDSHNGWAEIHPIMKLKILGNN
ncbi:MAG: hypothetical protein NVS1B13_15860 [Flavisolibacter sp.]